MSYLSSHYKKSNYWCEKAAKEREGSWAKIQLAKNYFYGVGVAQDYSKAFDYYHELAMLYDEAPQYASEAMQKLVDCYYYGIGVEQDFVKAQKWCKKGADLSLSWADSYLSQRFCDFTL